jgi:hypothetical protein
MPYAEATRNRDRWEADLLLNVVFAHMAFSSTKNIKGRKMAHDRFKNAVRQLYEFVNEDSLEAEAAEEAN